MAFGLKLRKTPKAEIDRRVKEAADLLGIEKLLDRKPSSFPAVSASVWRWAAPSSANPKSFCLTSRSQLGRQTARRDPCQHLQAAPAPWDYFIYVTHDQTEAMTMGTRIAVLKDGLLQQMDTPQILYDRPGNIFVAGFIGSPAMNFFDVKLKSSDGKLFIDAARSTWKCARSRQGAAIVRGKDLVLGIRPEDLHDPSSVRPAWCRVASRPKWM